MTPSQLAQVVCALAAAGASKHIQLVTLTGEPTHERALALQLLRSCHGVARVWQPLPVEGNASSASLADLIRRRYKREMTDVLFVAYIFSVTDVALLNKPELLELTSLSRLLLFVQSNFLSSSLREFHGQINNKVIFIEARASSMSAWEAFRTEPSEMAKPRYLSLVSSPPLQEQLDVLRRKPWYRRTNLTGLTLRCSLKNYVPFTVLKKLPGGLVSVSGLLGDVIDALATYLQMRIECREPKDKKWGAIRTPDGNWVGVLGDVVHGRADIALPYYYPMVERQTVFDFSHPIGDDWIVLVLHRPRALDGSNNYTRELAKDTWAAILILFSSSFLLWKLFFSYCNSEVHSAWGQGLITNFRIFCNMGWGEVDPRRTSFRIWTLTLLVVVMVLHVSYSSSLITILTSDRVVLPFHDLQGLHDTRGEYTLGFEADSVMDKMFKGAVSDLFKQLHDDLISKHPEYVEDIREGLHRVVMDPKHAYIMSKLLVPKKDCRLLALPQRLFSSQMSMMMAKDLPAAPIINYALLKMHEGGILQRLLRKYELQDDSAQSTKSHCALQMVTPLGLKQSYTAIQMLVVGWGAALLIFLLEILIKKRKSKNDGLSCRTS